MRIIRGWRHKANTLLPIFFLFCSTAFTRNTGHRCRLEAGCSKTNEEQKGGRLMNDRRQEKAERSKAGEKSSDCFFFLSLDLKMFRGNESLMSEWGGGEVDLFKFTGNWFSICWLLLACRLCPLLSNLFMLVTKKSKYLQKWPPRL